MSQCIEDYALVGDTHTAALVGLDGSIDWLCLPRFDSGACFAALLGDPDNGRWLLAPQGVERATSRRYRDGTLILETEFAADGGAVRVIDFLPIRDETPHIVRIVEGVSGSVAMRMELILRFDYGETVPWVRKQDGALTAVAGPNGAVLRTPVETRGRDLATVADFTVHAGDRVPFVLSWYPSHLAPPAGPDPAAALDYTDRWWRDWSNRCTHVGPWREAVVRSLITLKALTYAPTGGIVAAPTTSLPEMLGGVRNWDYRYCWLRDATFTLYALMHGGYRDEAERWRDWLLRAVAGAPDQLQILYGIAGERHVPESEAGWLPGYEGSRPVRIGNAAADQSQLDVFGEVMDALLVARRSGLEPDAAAWSLQRHLMRHLETVWRDPDEGIWEVRGGPRRFTHSRVMAWVALDRSIKTIEAFGLEGPLERWKEVRGAIHDDVCANGYDPDRGAFVQSYGSKALDASLLLIPLVGFLPVTDSRVLGTVRAIEKELIADGFVLRYRTEEVGPDGLPPGEGAFLPCTFWLADVYAQTGQKKEARRLFERLLGIRNDVGLLAEEFEPHTGRLLGNFPQALSHIALVNTASNLTPELKGTTEHRTEK
jgi:GH15 family glucan-1,4-alpha-glucosidase